MTRLHLSCGLLLLAAIGCCTLAHAQTTAPSAAPSSAPAPLSADWTPLFDGKTLEGFSTFVGGVGKDNDPEGYFKVEDGMIHILGIPETTERKQYGYLRTVKAYGDYHLRLQYKWGQKQFAPRLGQPRDSGVLYHMHGPDKVWANSIECQVQEGDTGEMIIVGTQVEAIVPIRMRGNQRVFDPNGTPTPINQGRVYKVPSPDSRTDWNTLEVITKGNKSVHIINGVVIMSLNDIHLKSGEPLTQGQIMLQAEGAEVWYRNVEIKAVGNDDQLPAPTPIPATQPAAP